MSAPLHQTPEGRAMLMASVAALRLEREALVARLVIVDRDISSYEQLLGGASPIAYAATAPIAHGPVTEVAAAAAHAVRRATTQRPPKTWREFIATIMRAAPGSLSAKEIIERGSGTEFDERYKSGPNGYYNTLRMMVLAEELFKKGKRYYTPERWAQLQSGTLVEDLPVEETRGSIPDAIFRVLAEHGGTLTPKGVITALARIPEFSEVATRKPELVRTHLTKLKQAAKLIKDNGQYKLPELARDLPPENIVLPFPGGGRG